MKPRCCIDFDGTITADCKTVMPGCIDVLNDLRETYSIAIFSARQSESEREQMRSLLDTLGVPYDEILPPKPVAEFYLDDKGRQFQGWDKVTL